MVDHISGEADPKAQQVEQNWGILQKRNDVGPMIRKDAIEDVSTVAKDHDIKAQKEIIPPRAQLAEQEKKNAEQENKIKNLVDKKKRHDDRSRRLQRLLKTVGQVPSGDVPKSGGDTKARYTKMRLRSQKRDSAKHRRTQDQDPKGPGTEYPLRATQSTRGWLAADFSSVPPA